MRIVIAGGGLAGSRTAERLRRAGYDGELTLVGGEPHAAYDRPPLSKKVLTQDDEPAEPLYLRAPDDLETLTGVHAAGLDPSAHTVTLDDGATLGYDRLVIATGVRPRRLFGDWQGVYVLRTWPDGVALRAALREAKRLVVIGGGVLGCEIAASARALDVTVTIVELLEQPLNTEWLAGSGVALDDGVVCDRTGATSVPDVWAAGDVARLPHPWAEGTIRLEHWQAAGDMAALVAGNLVADEPVPLTAVPYFWTDQYQSKFQVIGLPAPDDELTVLDGTLDGKFAAHYTRAGILTGAITVGMPAALAPFRKRIGTPIG